MNIPRPEHPKPQFMREDWINLNGEWDFEIDQGWTGEERGMAQKDYVFNSKITVPFCPESPLSGIGNLDYMLGVWYRRKIVLTGSQLCKKRVFLHFGAVDFRCNLFVNGEKVGYHKGGYVSFKFDITEYLTEGENSIVVFAQDNPRDGWAPSGKQSSKYASSGCLYRRTTGIWQTVWLEFTPVNYIRSFKFYPDIENGAVGVDMDFAGREDFTVEVYFEGRKVGSHHIKNAFGKPRFEITLSEKHLWDLGKGNLYDVEMNFGEDKVHTYFGLRKTEFEGKKFLLNNRSVFQRLVLDQGYYPDGIYTAPTDEQLERDIILSMSAGFNGARLHEKIFEERFLYYCDKHGYMVWGEYPDWGFGFELQGSLAGILPEWTEEIERDFNHPSIIGWCPHNETFVKQGTEKYDEHISGLYNITKLLDPTRPCIDTSGGRHVITDVYCIHTYTQNGEVLRKLFDSFDKEGVLAKEYQQQQVYKGEPVIMSEYGGIGWQVDDEYGYWGYENQPKDEEEFIRRFKECTEVFMKNRNICGVCYTQLTDVEQEKNGLFTFSRKPKFNVDNFREILVQKAAIED